MPTGMIVLASEQLWPNLLGLLHFCSQGESIQLLCILHTPDVGKSKEPAERLASLCRQKFPSMRIELSGPCPPQPQTVAAQLDKWIGSEDKNWQWIVNVTGGMKLSSFGTADLVPSPNERIRVIYLELSQKGQWYELTRGSNGIQAAPFDVGIGLSNSLTLAEAVLLQTGHKWKCMPVQRLSLAEVVQEGISKNWVWNSMNQRFGVKGRNGGKGNGSDLYEQLVANALEQMGITTVVTNVETNSSRPSEENDVMCLHNDIIYLLDCKLTTQEQVEAKMFKDDSSLITEAHDTSNRVRKLGGLRARGVLLRPHRDFSQDTHSPNAKSFFDEALNLSVWDYEECGHNFFLHLDALMHGEKSLGATWSDDLWRAHALLQQQKGRTVLWNSDEMRQIESKIPEGDFLNQANLLKELAKRQGHPQWWAHFDSNTVYLTVVSDKVWRYDNFKKFKEKIAPFATKGILPEIKLKDWRERKEIEFRLLSPSREQRQALYAALHDGTITW